MRKLPEFGSFAKTDTERKLLDMFRAFQYPRWPYIFPPGTPKDRVQIIREAMNKSFADPEFPVEYKKLMGDGPAPLNGEELESAIKELPREKEVVQLYQKARRRRSSAGAVKSREIKVSYSVYPRSRKSVW